MTPATSLRGLCLPPSVTAMRESDLQKSARVIRMAADAAESHGRDVQAAPSTARALADVLEELDQSLVTVRRLAQLIVDCYGGFHDGTMDSMEYSDVLEQAYNEAQGVLAASTASVTAMREREMTKQDWKALYLVYRLMEQIVLHGAIALDNFVAAMRDTPGDRHA